MFYTYYKQWGNTIFFSYIDDDGLQHHKKVSDYEPVLYLKTDEETDFKSIYGHNLSPVKMNSIRDAKDFIEKYKDVDGMDVEGNVKFATQFVIELFEGKMPDYKEDLIKGCILDIEVTAPEFPNPIEAKYEIDLMTLYNTREKVFKVFSLHDYDQTLDETDARKLKVDFKKYDSEAELLFDFLNYMRDQSFNWISGWNSDNFDIPYIINRCNQIHGKKTNRISPYGIVNIRETTDEFNNPALSVEIVGLPQLDYMKMYKKHIHTPRENYRLDYICEAELGKRKLTFEEEGSLYNLSRMNPQKYVSYNIIDVLRLVELEQKLGLFPVMYVLAYYAMSNLDSGLSTVDPWENFIAKELYIRGMVPPARDNSRQFRPFVGAYVADVQVGHHKNVVAFDLNSLYPHIMMQVNISPETHIPRAKLPPDLIELQNKLTVKDRSTYYLQCRNLVNKEEDLSLLKKYNVSMSASGQFYTKEQKGIVPQLAEELYNERKVYQREMREAERELINVEKLMKERGLL